MTAAGRGAQPIKGTQAQTHRQQAVYDLNQRANDYAEQQPPRQSYQQNNGRRQISENLSRGDN
jgi:hypothetical protein